MVDESQCPSLKRAEVKIAIAKADAGQWEDGGKGRVETASLSNRESRLHKYLPGAPGILPRRTLGLTLKKTSKVALHFERLRS